MSSKDSSNSKGNDLKKGSNSMIKYSFFKVIGTILDYQQINPVEFYVQHAILSFQNLSLCYNSNVY